MPKRIVDGNALWRSHRLKMVEPARFRAEYANLIPLALANGSFEADPDSIWSDVYSYNRPDVSREDVVAILDEFERVGMLVRWTETNGIQKLPSGNSGAPKPWGFWIGIDKPGRLPGESRRGKNEKKGAEVPSYLMDAIRKPLESNERPMDVNGNGKLLGFGFGLGSGLGIGSDKNQNIPPDLEPKVREIAKQYPRIADAMHMSPIHTLVIAEAIMRHGDKVLEGTKRFRAAYDKWPKEQRTYALGVEKFFKNSEYLLEPANHAPANGPHNLGPDYIPESQRRKQELEARKAQGL